MLNYYQHHIGDYAEATAHLSFVEDAAYSRLLRKIYAAEAPLPADTKAIQRLIGARTKEEREAVETVLQEFFTLNADGWHNKRADAEIASYQDKSAKARASAQASVVARSLKGSVSGRSADAQFPSSERSADVQLSNLQSPILRSESDSDISSEPDMSQARGKNPRADVAPRKGKKSTERGTRVPEPFVLSEDMRAWAQVQTPDVELEAATAEFVDYWRGIPGAKGRKLDWEGTWRNRLRELANKHAKRNGNGSDSGGGHESKQLKAWRQRKEALRNA